MRKTLLPFDYFPVELTIFRIVSDEDDLSVEITIDDSGRDKYCCYLLDGEGEFVSSDYMTKATLQHRFAWISKEIHFLVDRLTKSYQSIIKGITLVNRLVNQEEVLSYENGELIKLFLIRPFKHPPVIRTIFNQKTFKPDPIRCLVK